MAKDTKSYYDFDLDYESILVNNGMIEELFYLKDLKQRKLFLNCNITSDSVNEIVSHIMQFNADDKDVPVENRKPILLYINSCGGEVDAGCTLIDVIRVSNTPVYTINAGIAYSMAAIVAIAGNKRFSFENGKYLIHDGSNFVYDSSKKAEDRMQFQKRVDERIKDFIISNTNISKEEYEENDRVEWYMFADEANRKGLCDFIIGVDCSLDEIV